MHNKVLKFIAAALASIFLAVCFAGCGNSSQSPVKSDKEMDVVILSGQSNAVGYSRWDEVDRSFEDVGVFRYGEGVVAEALTDTDNLAKVQWGILRNGLGRNAMTFGPEMGIGQVFSERYKTEKNDIGIIKYVCGGKALWDYWLSPSSVSRHIGKWDGDLETLEVKDDTVKCGKGFRYIVETVREAIKKAEQSGYNKVNIIGMCWMQGENDMYVSGSATLYGMLLKNFLQDLREILAVENLPVAIGQAKMGASTHPTYPDQINKLQKKVCDEDEYAVLVPTDDLGMQPDDQAHYDTQSMKTLGLRFGNALAGLLG